MRLIASRFRMTFRSAAVTGTLLLTALTLSVSSSHNSHASGKAGQASVRPSNPQHRHRWFQFGRASWYGSEFQGQATASGEVFDMYGMTCAHPSLPLGALVRVTNLHNHKSVVVRVNDRGPMLPTRIVDLSYAAAKAIGFRGMTRVRIDLIDAAPTAAEIVRLTWPAPVQP